MAAGALIKHKRKAGAFVNGDLAAGEFGVDVSNSNVYFSVNGTTVVMIGAGAGTVGTAGTPLAGQYARFTDGVTIEGRTTSQHKADLSLDNVTNESKPTMFTNPTFTGVVTVPTASAGDSSTKAASTAFVAGEITSATLGIVNRTRVKTYSTGNITISTALNNGDVVNGVTLATDDLVLVPNQTAPEENGVYVVGVTPARSAQFDTYDEHVGAIIVVEEGTTNADSIWYSTSNLGGTLNTTAINFTKLVIAGELIATNNLSDLNNILTSRTNLGIGTGDSPQFAGLNIGHATDTTVTRTGAGDIAVEGNQIFRAGGTDVPVTDGGTGASTASGARTNLGLAIGSDVAAFSHTHAATDITSGDLATARMQVNVVAAINAGGGTVNNSGVTIDGGSI